MPKKKVAVPRVPRTRNDGTMTEAQFRGWVRSSLRKMSMRWRPIYGILNDVKRPVTPEDKEKWGNRIKYVYQCGSCTEWFPRTVVEVDHIVPCGSLNDIEKDAGPFILRMLCERPGLRVVCGTCHQAITNGIKS